MSHTFDAFNSWKALAYPDRIDKILNGSVPTPVICHVYPTNRCNRNCGNCIMAEEQQDGAELSREVFVELMEDLNSRDVLAVHIVGGGEPTLYPHLEEVKRFKGKRLLTTNGVELTRHTAELFDRVRVSVNAGSMFTYADYHRTNDIGEFQRLITGLEAVSHKPRSFQIGYVMCADACNWQDIPALARIASSHGVDFLQIRPAWYPRGRAAGLEVHRLAPAMFHAAEAAKAAYNVPIFAMSEKFDGFWGARNYTACRATPLSAVVTASGQLSVCLDVFHKWGDLNKEGFWDAWHSQRHHDAIAAICLADCPRCVLDMPNQIIEHVFVRDECWMGVL